MSPPCLALVRDVLNGPNSMTAEAAHRFDNLFACLCISTCAARRQFLRLGLRPQVLGDRIVTFVAARFDAVHRVHRRFEEMIFVPAVLLFPLFTLLFAPRRVAGILETGRAIEPGVAGSATEGLQRMRRP